MKDIITLFVLANSVDCISILEDRFHLHSFCPGNVMMLANNSLCILCRSYWINIGKRKASLSALQDCGKGANHDWTLSFVLIP